LYAEPGTPASSTTFLAARRGGTTHVLEKHGALLERESERAARDLPPVDGEQAHVVRDPSSSPVGRWGLDRGEAVYLGGERGVSGAAIIGRPEWRAERLRPDPFTAGTWGTVYRVGDWLFALSAEMAGRHPGVLGRLDHQVKVGGGFPRSSGEGGSRRCCSKKRAGARGGVLARAKDPSGKLARVA